MRTSYDFSKGKRGAVIDRPGKTRITIHLDYDVLAAFRERATEVGMGYQTLINQALREHLADQPAPLDEDTRRRILREELGRAR
jgi:uncharacterized protein (DUF4415 family)